MAEPQEYESSALLLNRVAEILYRSPGSQKFILREQLYCGIPDADALAIDSSLKKMEDHDLLSIDLSGSKIGLLGYGKVIYEQNCVPEVVLGREYIAKKYRSAIFHIIVAGADGEDGGTGFFSADYPNRIITAGHVVRNRKINRIEDSSGAEIPLKSSRKYLSPDPTLDIAAIDCQMPADVQAIRIEWNTREFSLGSELIVFGYPKIASHLPTLYQSKAELHAIPKRYASNRDSLIISSSTHPGCSGGPVLDKRGFALGVIEQENMLEMASGLRAFFGATPAHYLKEFM